MQGYLSLRSIGGDLFYLTTTRMNDISVLFNIWDVVEHSFNEKIFKIIWYEYIPPIVRYICLQQDNTDYCYMKDCELKHNKETQIWFSIKK